MLGEFVWTGFDYLGEPTPYFAWDKPRDEKDWPARSSYFGIVDLAGFPKDRFYLYQSQWTTKPMVHVLPHWNWAGREGQPIPVMAYTNAEEVELFLNGRSLGRKKKGEPYVMPVGQKISDDLRFTTKYRLVWEVPYAPGTLTAVAYTGGKPVASTEVRTAGAPARVALVPDRTTASTPTARTCRSSRCASRTPTATSCRAPTTSCASRSRAPGRIAAVDNGNAASLEPFQAEERKAFCGLALARSCARTAACRARSASRPRRTASPRPGPSSRRSEGRRSERDEVLREFRDDER